MIAETICVGTELLMGQTQNTHASYIAAHLAAAGITQRYQDVVGDNAPRLADTIRLALSRSDIVIACGGLGPTFDDITKETVCAVLELPMELYEDEWATVQSFFTARGKAVPPDNIKQAMFPPREFCVILPNAMGTAPGCIIEKNGKAVICLPGPPRELQPMFENHVLPYLRRRSDGLFQTRIIRIFGIGESEITHRLKDVLDRQTNPTIAPYAKTGENILRVTANCKYAAEGERIIAPVIAEIKSILGDFVYSDSGQDLPALCHAMLISQRQTLAIAESCTGGLLCSAFVDLPDSSTYFVGGAVTYSNAEKVRVLGVAESTLKEYGAVSPECAREMANGICVATGASIALATTGIAGPGGGTTEKPVGLVYIALADSAETQIRELRLHGDRAKNREMIVLHALDMLRRRLTDKNSGDDITMLCPISPATDRRQV